MWGCTYLHLPVETVDTSRGDETCAKPTRAGLVGIRDAIMERVQTSIQLDVDKECARRSSWTTGGADMALKQTRGGPPCPAGRYFPNSTPPVLWVPTARAPTRHRPWPAHCVHPTTPGSYTVQWGGKIKKNDKRQNGSGVMVHHPQSCRLIVMAQGYMERQATANYHGMHVSAGASQRSYGDEAVVIGDFKGGLHGPSRIVDPQLVYSEPRCIRAGKGWTYYTSGPVSQRNVPRC